MIELLNDGISAYGPTHKRALPHRMHAARSAQRRAYQGFVSGLFLWLLLFGLLVDDSSDGYHLC